MSVEDDDWATAVDIQEGLTKVEIQPSKPVNAGKNNEQDEFTRVSHLFRFPAVSTDFIPVLRG